MINSVLLIFLPMGENFPGTDSKEYFDSSAVQSSFNYFTNNMAYSNMAFLYALSIW